MSDSYSVHETAARPTNVKAIVALVLAAASFFGLSLLGSIPAIVLGTMARREIQASGEQGDQLARGAIIAGWVSIGISVPAGVAFLLVFVVFAGLIASSPHVAECAGQYACR